MSMNDILISSAEQGNDNMDMSVNYDNAELMTSEFFNSVLSLENDLEDGFLSNFEDEHNTSSDTSHSDEVLSPKSCYSESDKNSMYSTENTDTDSSSVLNSIDGIDDPIFLSFLDTITRDQDTKEASVLKITAPTLVGVGDTPTPSTPHKATKLLIQNPTNKKCIAKPISNATQLRKSSNVKPQILKVQQITNNGRSVLVPFSFKGIKILNTSTDVSALTSNKRQKIEPIYSVQTDDDTVKPAVTTNQYPPLNLSNEEKRLLAKEGIQLPSHYPLTKNEERELKRIRRKIRNKISAQDSRKRKKEYVDGLEERVKRGSEENKNLLQRVKELQRQNRTLIAHVNKLQALICKSSTSKATPSTCLMVVLLSALLVSLPNMRLFENKQFSQSSEQVSTRRSLLSDLQATEDDLNMEEFLVFKDDEPDVEIKYDDDVHGIDNTTGKELSKILDNMSKQYEDFMIDKNGSDKMSVLNRLMEAMKHFITEKKWGSSGMKSSSFGGIYNKNGFLEPDIDDYKPGNEELPFKRARYSDEYEVSSTNIISENIIATTAANQVTKDK